jgi:hypothetical protein
MSGARVNKEKPRAWDGILRQHRKQKRGAKCQRAITILKGRLMLYTIAVILIILWLLGLVTSYTLGGFIHILLVIAIVVILVRLISGRGI